MTSDKKRTDALPLTEVESAPVIKINTVTEETAQASISKRESAVEAVEAEAPALPEGDEATTDGEDAAAEAETEPVAGGEDAVAEAEAEPAADGADAVTEADDEAAADGEDTVAEADDEPAADGEDAVAEAEAEAVADGEDAVAEAEAEAVADGEDTVAEAEAEPVAGGEDAVAEAPALPEGDEPEAAVTEHADIELTEAIDEEIAAVAADEGEEATVAEVRVREEKKARASGTRRVDSLFDFIELFVFTLAVVLFISAFFVRHSVVEGDSMLGTLHSGENLLISDFLYTPERGDIVVVEDHSTILKKPIIKRVIALGGDVVRITRGGVIINGEPLVEEYVFTDDEGYVYDIYPSEALLTNDTLVVKPGEYYEFVVPEGELFVMGDHRNRSTDSREIGTVDEDAVLGRVILRFYPFDKFGTVD